MIANLNRAVRPTQNRYLIVRLLIPSLICLGGSSCTSSFDRAAKAAQPALNISTPVRIGEARIKNEWNDTIHPWVAERTDDGGYIVAGTSGSPAVTIPHNNGGPRGWAVKIDQSGRVLWTYYSAPRDLASAQPGKPIYGAPTYYGAVSMPDGSTFLCGQMPHVSRSDKPGGLLTHLDPKGALIS